MTLYLPEPEFDYPVIPPPKAMQHDTGWSIPSPEILKARLNIPLRGLWIDHVPHDLEIAVRDLIGYGTPEEALTSPLITGHWEKCHVWSFGHPALDTPQTVMPDNWFDHPDAERPRPRSPDIPLRAEAPPSA